MQATKPAVFDRRSVTRRVMFLNSRSSMFKLTISERRNPPANPSRMIALFRSERMSRPHISHSATMSSVRSARAPFSLLLKVRRMPSRVLLSAGPIFPRRIFMWEHRLSRVSAQCKPPSAQGRVLWNSLRPSASDKESTLSAGACPIYMDDVWEPLCEQFHCPRFGRGIWTLLLEVGHSRRVVPPRIQAAMPAFATVVCTGIR